MDAEKLRRVRDAYKERKQLAEKITEFEAMRISPRITAYGGERVQSSPKGDIQPEAIAKLDALIAAYGKKLDECVELILDFEHAIATLRGRDRCIMRMYYIDGMTWEQVCVEVDVSWRQLYRIRARILKELCKRDTMSV